MLKKSHRAKTASVRDQLIQAAARLADRVDTIAIEPPVTHIYNPLRYAWQPHVAYLEQANDERIRVLFLGMNPGPWGMAQTGVPFGEVTAVRDWIGIREPVQRPEPEHPKRPVTGFECARSEVSGRRLWGLFQKHFENAAQFFQDSLVLNYCPLVFMEASGKNRTPDKLSKSERVAIESACDAHLREALVASRCEFAVGIGAYAEAALSKAVHSVSHPCVVTRILHPSPASPAANRDWQGTVTSQLTVAGIWPPIA